MKVQASRELRLVLLLLSEPRPQETMFQELKEENKRMKRKHKNFMRCIISLVLTVVMVLGEVPVEGLVMKAQATTTASITVDGTDYVLFTGFTATDGTYGSYGYENFVDGDPSSKWLITKRNPDRPDHPWDFAGGEDDPAFVEFHADGPFIPKGYVLTCEDEHAGSWKPREWGLKAKLNEDDEWTPIHLSIRGLGEGKIFEFACDDSSDNPYQYFRFEIYDIEADPEICLDELQFYGIFQSVAARAASCTEYGLTNAAYIGLDGKYYAEVYCQTELTVGNGLIERLPHTAVHHEASSTNIDHWQCSVCHKWHIGHYSEKKDIPVASFSQASPLLQCCSN